jgi:hypothetical protein
MAKRPTVEVDEEYLKEVMAQGALSRLKGDNRRHPLCTSLKSILFRRCYQQTKINMLLMFISNLEIKINSHSFSFVAGILK